MDSQNNSSSQNNDKYQDIVTNDIFSLMGFQDLDQEKKDELAKKMIETINARVINRLDNMLKENEMKKFLDFMDKENIDEANQFLSDKNINMDELIAEETLAYKLQMTKQAEFMKKTSKKDTPNKQ